MDWSGSEVIAIVAVVVALFLALTRKAKPAKLNMQSLREAADIAKAQAEVERLVTESTRDSEEYKKAKAEHRAKYPITVLGVVDGSKPDDSKR